MKIKWQINLRERLYFNNKYYIKKKEVTSLKKTIVADSSLLFVAFIWGATFVIVQNAIQVLPPNLFNCIRFFIAALLLMIFMRKKFHTLFSFQLLKSGISLGFFLFLGYGLQTVGLLYTTSSKSSFITGLSVMIVPLLSIWLLREKPKFVIFLGSIIGSAGLYFLTVGDIENMNIGDVLTLLCAVAFALHIILTSKYSEKHKTLPLTIVQLGTVSIFSFISSLLFERSTQFSFASIINEEVIVALTITSIFATALAFLIQTTFQQHTSAARVALIFAMEPVFAAITAYVVIDERLTQNGLIGCTFIFLAMIVTDLPNFKKIKGFLIKQKPSM